MSPDEGAFDLLIRGGTIVDGSGAPPFVGDIGLREGRIIAVGRVEGPAARTIDAAGLAVSPGFIDVHSHDDAAVMSTCMDFKLMQGVTTVIAGNCGAGVAPLRDDGSFAIPGMDTVLGALPEVTWRTFGEYMQAVARSEPAINVGCFVPHGVVRYRHLGMDHRAPSAAELGAMRADVEEGMAAGALGLSTGLIYPPGAFAQTEELIALTDAVAEHGGIYMSHIRDESGRLLDAVSEAIRIGREAGTPVQISHHKASGRSNWGKTEDSIALIERERDAGTDVTFDAYPYTAASTVLAVMARAPEPLPPEAILVSSVSGQPEWEGKTVAQLADNFACSPDEAIRRVLAADPGALAVFFLMHEDDVRRVLAHPLCMIGSDGIPSAGKPHPRLYGTFPRVLGKYVREEKLMALEEGVRKMTSLPAARMGLGDRGLLKAGYAADIAVFDPDAISDRATYEDPRQYPAGIEYVIVNGQVAAERGELRTAVRAGRLLRRGAASRPQEEREASHGH